MAKLLVALLAVSGLAAAVALVPLNGRTVLDRWRSSRDAVEFLGRGWAEARAVLGLDPAKPASPRGQASRGGKPPPREGRPARPQEQHSAQDRAALERIIAEHAGR